MRRVLDKKELARGRWLRMLEVSYSITEEKTGKWEMAERTTKKQESDGIPGQKGDISLFF